jgi:hypothetical protein
MPSPSATEPTRTVKASDVQLGDVIRFPDGTDLEVSHIEARFFDRDDMMAFIEDTAQRWLKRPVPTGADVEVLIRRG